MSFDLPEGLYIPRGVGAEMANDRGTARRLECREKGGGGLEPGRP